MSPRTAAAPLAASTPSLAATLSEGSEKASCGMKGAMRGVALPRLAREPDAGDHAKHDEVPHADSGRKGPESKPQRHFSPVMAARHPDAAAEIAAPFRSIDAGRLHADHGLSRDFDDPRASAVRTCRAGLRASNWGPATARRGESRSRAKPKHERA